MKEKSDKELKIKTFLQSKGLTYKKAGEILGTHQSAIGNLVAGRVPFGEKVAKKWEDAFGIRAKWLMYDEEPMMVETEDEPQTIVNVSHASGNGVAVSGHHPDVLVGGQQPNEFAEIIKKQQEQIDRLLSIIEKQITK